jgi:hypothetical protein
MYKLITDYTVISVSGTTSNKASSIESEAKRLIKEDWTPLVHNHATFSGRTR